MKENAMKSVRGQVGVIVLFDKIKLGDECKCGNSQD